MSRKILMPKLGLTMTEGVLSEWMVQPGEPFKAEQGLFVIETDKVATEVPAEDAGVLTQVLVQPGTTVPVGEVLGYWEEIGAASRQQAAQHVVSATGLLAGCTPPAPAELAESAAASHGARIIATPLAKRIAAQKGVDLSGLRGSGPNGRIKAADVEAASATAALAAPSPVPEMSAPAATPSVPDARRSQPDAVMATMARRLSAVKQEVPHFYLSLEADVGALLKLRRELNGLDGAMRFTLNHFIVAAAGRALADLPHLNRVWADGEIVSYASSDVGMAVQTPRGLMVPIVRDAGRVSLTEAARRAQALVERARAGRLGAGDLTGGALTVSNAGMHRVKFMTPIINPGQAMILGVGSVIQAFRPDAEGRPVLRDELGLVLAADHRLLDGVLGLEFLNKTASYLEQPLKLLVGA